MTLECSWPNVVKLSEPVAKTEEKKGYLSTLWVLFGFCPLLKLAYLSLRAPSLRCSYDKPQQPQY